MEKSTQEQQVINVLRKTGGYATLRRLNELVNMGTGTCSHFCTQNCGIMRAKEYIAQNSDSIGHLAEVIY